MGSSLAGRGVGRTNSPCQSYASLPVPASLLRVLTTGLSVFCSIKGGRVTTTEATSATRTERLPSSRLESFSGSVRRLPCSPTAPSQGESESVPKLTRAETHSAWLSLCSGRHSGRSGSRVGCAVLSKSVSSRFGLHSLKLRPLTHLRPLPYPQISLPCLLESNARQLACLGLDSLSRDVRAEELRRPSVARVARVASVGRRENAARVQLDGAHAQVRRSSVDVPASVDDGFQRVHLVPPVVLLWINALLATHLDRPPSRAIVASRIWSTQALTHSPTGPGIDIWSVSSRERVWVGFVGGERAGSVPAVHAVEESLFAAEPSRSARIVRQRRTHESKGVWIVGQQLRRQLPYVVSFTRRIARQKGTLDAQFAE